MNLLVSYSRADQPFAKLLIRCLQALGATLFDPARDIGTGENFQAALRKALEDSDGVILLVPEPGSSGANLAFFEAGAARAMGKPVIPIIPKPEMSRIRELPSDLYGLAVLDGSHQSPEALARSIIASLKIAA